MILEASGAVKSSDPTLASNGNYVILPLGGRFGGLAIQITGTWTGQLEFEISNDGVTFVSLKCIATDGATAATNATANGMWFVNVAAAKFVQVRASAAMTGSASVFISASVTPVASVSTSGGGGGGTGDASAANQTSQITQETAINTILGLLADAAQFDANGTINAHQRAAAKVLGDVWSAVLHALKVDIVTASLPVTQSGSWALSAGSALVGKVGIDQTTPGTTDSVTLATAQGAGATIGAVADAVVAAGAAGTLSAKLRAISRDLVANIVLAAGANVIGKVTIDQTTPGTTDSVSVATGQGAGATIGAAADAVVAAGAAGTLSAKLRAISRDLVANIVLAAGTNLIGKVGLDQTTPGTTNGVQVNAGTALMGRASSSDETSTVYNGTTALTPKFAKISVSSSGATTVVALVGGKKIRVLRWDVVCAAAVSVKWQSHVTPTDLTGAYPFAANGGKEGVYAKCGHFETVAGEALDINLSAAVQVSGVLTYVEV